MPRALFPSFFINTDTQNIVAKVFNSNKYLVTFLFIYLLTISGCLLLSSSTTRGCVNNKQTTVSLMFCDRNNAIERERLSEFSNRKWSIVFTALRAMQTRSSDENSVCPSVRLSVRPSIRHTRGL